MRGLGLAAGGLCLAALPAFAQECPLPDSVGRFVLPPAPCFDYEVTLEDPTTRYAHGVLGDDVEYTVLSVKKDRTTVRAKVPITQVFEDLAPRVVELDGSGPPEIVVVEANDRAGAALVIYQPDFRAGRRPKVVRLAATPWIGARYKWLAPAAAADFDGDGTKDIAYVETPHEAGVLKFVTLKGARLEEIASAEGFSNHREGDDFISGGVRDCGAGPEVVMATLDWAKVVAAHLEDGKVVSTELGPYEGPESFDAALACEAQGS